jgi:cholesterol oxidase
VRRYSYDWLVIGSGFGGSVSALRLAQKGYRVAVVEAGRRFADHELPKSSWNVRRYWFLPQIGLNGIFRLTIFKDVAIVSGAGVGGGSLVYANTLYRAPKRFYKDPQWSSLNDWEAALAPHYDEAERMLGVVSYDQDDPADDHLRAFARELGVEDTYAKTRVGVFLGEPGVRVPDPYFGGEGPARTGCVAAGAAWSAARTTPRTRSSRTTCGSPSGRGRRSSRSAPWSTSGRSARTTARTATR